MTKQKLDKVDLTIVGGQPLKTRQMPGAGDVEVPAGLELLLYRASGDASFRKQLLADRDAAIDASGIELRPSERATLRTIDDAALNRMIGALEPDNPWGRKVMRRVAAAATSLAAGTAAATVLVDCSCSSTSDGIEPSTGVDTTTSSTGSTSTGTTQTGMGGTGGEAGTGGGGGTGGTGGDAGAGGGGGTGGG